MKNDMTYLRPYLVLVVLSLVIYLPVSLQASQFLHDYGNHIKLALELPESARRINHVFYHAVFLLAHRLLPSLLLPQAAVAAILTFMLPVPLMAFSIFKKAANQSLPDWLLMAFALGLTILAPVTIWTNSFMLGYFNPIVYHNPTIIALRLFAIPVSLLAARVFCERPFESMNQQIFLILLCAVLVLLATLTKPSYTFVLLPGCCVYAVWRLLRWRHINIPFLIFAICLPGVLMLGLMYLLAYYGFDDGSSLAIGAFTFMKLHIPTWRIPIQLMLSLIFPAGLYLCYPIQARRDLYLNLSWLIFGVGAAVVYLLYETGPRLHHGNFLWSGYSAVFVLMFASILFFCRVRSSGQQREDRKTLSILGLRFTGRDVFVMLLFTMHLVSGIAYYFRFLGLTSLP